mgnify:CR=1 FL=1
MALTKVEADGINLADTFAFTGTVSGANTYVSLLNVDTISNVSSYHVNNTYINDTYDFYFVSAFFKPATDGVKLYSRVFVGGAVQDGSIYGWETSSPVHGNTNINGTTYFQYTHDNTGNGTGEGVHFHNHYYANNEKTNMIFWHGSTSHLATNGSHVGSTTSGASGTPLTMYQYSLVGMDFYFSSGNISTGRINVYGIKGYV